MEKYRNTIFLCCISIFLFVDMFWIIFVPTTIIMMPISVFFQGIMAYFITNSIIELYDIYEKDKK
jgi:hypothetical protein